MFSQPPADLLVQQAAAALAAGCDESAEAALNAALGADPHHLMALTKLAELALGRRDHALAVERLDAVLAIEPMFAPAWGELSHAHWLAGRHQDALAAARRGVFIQPPNPGLRLRLAQVAAWTGHGDEAREALAPLLDPDRCDGATHAAAISMRGEAAMAGGRFHDADADLRRALDLLPGLQATRMMLGMNQLRLGRFADGWANYAERERMAAFRTGDHPGPRAEAWHGQDLEGKTILVADDQGHGDAIQFFRYLPLLKALGPGRITLRSFAPLVRLLAEAAPYADVVAGLPDDARFDYRCTSSSLPRRFGTTLGTIPGAVPYLRPPSRRGRFAGRGGARRLQVGLAWSGDERHMRDHLRSIPAGLFLTLADVPGVRFHSLQWTVRPLDLPALDARPAIDRRVEHAVDFADSAALAAGLDLVITVDTAVAHLAGALGRPVWVLLHVAPDWRWLTERTDSPWYPTARLFRVAPGEWGAAAREAPGADVEDAACAARPDGGWRPVLQRVAAALRTLAAG